MAKRVRSVVVGPIRNRFRREPPTACRFVIGALVALAGLLAHAPAAAQLRPIDPLDWTLLDGGWTVDARAGGALYDGQRASLAGVRGRLAEAGLAALSWRLGGPVVRVEGAALRILSVDSSYAAPVPGVAAPEGRLRDAGELRVETLVPLARGSRVASALRFGSRLPISDSRHGLGRDRTDFFALVGGRVRSGATSLSVEVGVGINGTLASTYYEQVDVLLYAARVSRRFGPFQAGAALVGQAEGISGDAVRGNEDLQELRLQLRGGRRAWLQVEGVRGFRRFSPQWGIRLLVGGRR